MLFEIISCSLEFCSVWHRFKFQNRFDRHMKTSFNNFKAFQITSFLANLHNRVHVSILSITKIRAKQHPTYFLGNLKITLGQKCIHELCFLPKLVKVMKSFYHHGLLINIHHKDAFLFLQVVLVMESSFCQIRIFLTQQVNWCSTQKAMEWFSLQMFWNLVV